MKLITKTFFSFVASVMMTAGVKSQIISTIAGIGNGDGYQATSVGIRGGTKSFTIANDKSGNLFFSDGRTVRKVSPNGVLSTIAGSPAYSGYGGDGGPAKNATFVFAYNLATDTSGNIYVTDSDNNRIRKIDKNGIISTVAGTTTRGFSGDGGLAIAAQLQNPRQTAVDAAGNIYIADAGNSRIRKIATNGVISTIAGGGTNALAVGLLASNCYVPTSSIGVDSKGNLYFNSYNATFQYGIFKVSPAGIVLKFITSSNLSSTTGHSINIDSLDNVYITNNSSSKSQSNIQKIDTSGTVTTFTSNSIIGLSNYHSNVCFDNNGAVYVPTVDSTIQIYGIVKINKNGSVTNVAGNGTAYFNGDAINATDAQFFPAGIATDNNGNIYVADNFSRIRKISANGIITTIVGSNAIGFSGDGGLAINARIYNPFGITLDKFGNLFICDEINHKIRKVNATTGVITSIAGVDKFGVGQRGYNGDGIAADTAYLNYPLGIAVDTFGNVYVADQSNHRIRKISPNGIINTIAGTGVAGYSGDGGLGINAQINAPVCIATDSQGDVYFSDNSKTVRKVTASTGIITTIAGTGATGYSGDGGKAKNATFNIPTGILVLNNGTIFIADYLNNVVRKIGTDSIISTYAGTGTNGYSGDGGLASLGQLNTPISLALDNSSNLLIAEAYGYRIRKVTPAVLPLNLLNFTAHQQNNTVNLSWQTTNEVNTSHFTIQRSVDGTSFNNIGKVAAKGDSNYSYTDDLSTINHNLSPIYYRLQMVDKDGSFTYSKIVSCQLSIVSKALAIYPNPVKDNLFVQFTSTKAEKLTLQVTDLQGRLLQQEDTQVGVGNVSLSVNTSTLAKGSYVLLVKGSTGLQQKQFVKE